METAQVSSRYRVIIPGGVRKSLGLRPGQRLHVLPYRNRIELIPVRLIVEMRGFRKGVDTAVVRDPDRR
jgi:AbrB family looped-hinge helix DNA binding protein